MYSVTPGIRRIFRRKKMTPSPHSPVAGLLDLLLSIFMLLTLTLLLTPGGLWAGLS